MDLLRSPYSFTLVFFNDPFSTLLTSILTSHLLGNTECDGTH